MLKDFNVFNVTRGQDPYAIWSFLFCFVYLAGQITLNPTEIKTTANVSRQIVHDR